MLPWVSAFQGSLSETFPGPFDSGSSHTLCRPEDCSSDPPAPQSVDRSPTSSIRSVVPKHEARTEHPHRLFAPARSLAFGHCAPRAMCSLLIVSCITADQTDDLWGTFLPCRSRRDSLAVPDIPAGCKARSLDLFLQPRAFRHCLLQHCLPAVLSSALRWNSGTKRHSGIWCTYPGGFMQLFRSLRGRSPLFSEAL
jgi:hypothetical protein